MELQIVSKTIAEGLKEIGFDWECNIIYEDEEEDAIELSYYMGDGSGVVKNSYLKCSNGTEDAIATAPTQALVCKWLREVHKLTIEIEYIDSTIAHMYEATIKDSIKREYADEDMIDQASITYVISHYDTYEEAEAEGIKEAIKIIKDRQ